MTTNKEQLTRFQELKGITPLLLGVLKNPIITLPILQKYGLLGLLLTSENAYEVCHRALKDAPREDKLELLRILDKVGLLDPLTSEQAYEICTEALVGAHGDNKFKLLGMLDETGLLSRLTPDGAHRFLH